MKKLVSLLLVGIMVLAFAACTKKPPEVNKPDWLAEVPTVTDADKIANYKDAYKGDKENGPVWYYLCDDGTGIRELHYTEEWGDNWQYSENPTVDQVYYSLMDWEGLKVNAGMWGDVNVKIIIGWRAYKDGTAKIGEWDYTAYDGSNNLEGFVAGSKVTILHNDTEIWTGTSTAEGGDVYEGTEVEVKEGDFIYFVFDSKDASTAHHALDTLSVTLE